MPSKKNDRCIVFYRLTPLSFPFFALATKLYERVYYCKCTSGIKRRFGTWIIGSGARQITEHALFGKGVLEDGHISVVNSVAALMARNAPLADMMEDYGGNPRFRDVMSRAFMAAWRQHAMHLVPLAWTVDQVAPQCACIDIVWDLGLHATDWLERLPANARVLAWHRPLVRTAQFFIRLILVGGMFWFPLVNMWSLIRKGVRGVPAQDLGPKPAEKILFVHRYAMQFADISRNAYILANGIVSPKDCVHVLMTTSATFDAGKKAYLDNGRNNVVNISDIRLPIGRFTRLILADFYRSYFRNLFGLLGCKEFTRDVFPHLLEALHLTPICRAIIERVSAKVLFLESETAPFSNILAAAAAGAGLKTVSMIHGAGAQVRPNSARINMIFDVVFTAGNLFQSLQHFCPKVGSIIAVGNHEADLALASKGAAASAVRELVAPGQRIVGFFMMLQLQLNNLRSTFSQTEYVDEDAVRQYFTRQFEPLFRLLARRDDVTLVWKPKVRTLSESFDHPWMRPLAGLVPRERLVMMPEQATMVDVIRASDVCIGINASSSVSTSMALGKPVVSFDVDGRGWTRKYHPDMAATNGQELADKLERLLDHGLPEDAFRKFNADWYADGIIDFKTAERMAAVFERLIAQQAGDPAAQPETVQP